MINSVIGLVLVLLTMTKDKQVPAYDVRAEAITICTEYKLDKQKADAKYLNRRVFLHGKVKEVSATGQNVYFYVPDLNDFVAVIDGDQLVAAPQYKPNDDFAMICTGAGLVFGGPLFLHCRMP